MEIDYREIGKRIRDRRIFIGYSQEKLAFDCGFSVPYISQIENGHKSASLNVLLQIADVMDCSLDWLVFGSDSFYIGEDGIDFNYPIENCTREEKMYLYNLLILNIKMLKSKHINLDKV